SAATTVAHPTASLAGKPGRRCAISRARSACRRTVLPPPTCWNDCGAIKAGALRPNRPKNPVLHNLDGPAQRNLRQVGISPLEARFRYYGVLDHPPRPSRMLKQSRLLKVLTEPGPSIVLVVTIALLVGVVAPASAQFFNFGGWNRPSQPRSGGGWFGS